jgi:hypothetical protein
MVLKKTKDWFVGLVMGLWAQVKKLEEGIKENNIYFVE